MDMRRQFRRRKHCCPYVSLYALEQLPGLPASRPSAFGIGLDVSGPTTAASEKKRGLWMAAETASVSYSSELAPETLGTHWRAAMLPNPSWHT